VTLLFVALACGRQALAQLGFGTCSIPTDVPAPRYVGKTAGKDAVEVTFTVGRALTQGGFGGGAFPANGANACAVQAGLGASVEVTVSVTRAGGHKDKGTLSVGAPLGQLTVRNVEVPRGLLETDPRHYVVELKGKVARPLTLQVAASGSGLPSLQGATQTVSAPQIGASFGEGCLPKPAITGLSSAGGGGAQESATVSWAFAGAGAFGLCLRLQPATVRVTLRRANGTTSVGSASVPAGTTTATVSIPGPASPVASFEAAVVIPGTLEIPVSGRVEGSF